MSVRATLCRLRAESAGASVLEFGLVAPILFALSFGTFELGYGIYSSAVLSGAVQAAGRASGLESAQGGQAAIDARVAEQIHALVPTAELEFERRSYQEFSDVGRPEDFTDANSNSEYDDDECFVDDNGNETWDADVGVDGQGGANDVVLYEVTMRYDRVIPVGGFFGLSGQREFSSETTLRNQPFATQSTQQSTQICP